MQNSASCPEDPKPWTGTDSTFGCEGPLIDLAQPGTMTCDAGTRKVQQLTPVKNVRSPVMLSMTSAFRDTLSSPNIF